MNESLRDRVEQRSQTYFSRIDTEWFYLYKVHKLVKLCAVKRWDSVILGGYDGIGAQTGAFKVLLIY